MANALTVMLPIDPDKDVTKLLAEINENKGAANEALTSIGTVHFARQILLDRSVDDLQPNFRSTLPGRRGPFVLAVITEYDGDFDAYIEDFTAKIGPFFDIPLAYTTDGKDLVPVKENVKKFQLYLKSHDLSQYNPNQNLYSAYPLTVQQILSFPQTKAVST